MSYDTNRTNISLSNIGIRAPNTAPTAGSIIYVPSAGGGWDELAISVPGTANFQNVLGVNTSDTTVAWKQHYDNTNPASIGTLAPGTSVISARRDHVHDLPLAAVPAHNLLSTTHGDTTASTVTRGDLIVGTGATPAWDDLVLGASGTYLGSDGTDALWRAQSTISHDSIGDVSADDHHAQAHGASDHTNRTRSSDLIKNDSGGPIWADAVTTDKQFIAIVPQDYASGDITIKIRRRGAATNTAVMSYEVYRFRDATAQSLVISTTGANFTPGDVNSHDLSITVTAANVQIGDTLRLDFHRTGADASDTMTDNVNYDGSWMEYTADM